MAEFLEVMKIRHRMCKSRKSCEDCPLNNNHQNKICYSFLVEYPEEVEQICLEWAKENPEITNKDKFYQIIKEAFGEEIANKFKDLFPCEYLDCENVANCDKCKYHDFWKKPYVEPKGEE